MFILFNIFIYIFIMVTTNKFIIFLLVFVMSLDKVMKARNKEKEDDVTNM